MTDHLFDQTDGATPLTADEREGLIPSYITLRDELNDAEQANILEAEEWAFARKRNVLDDSFLNRLHNRMFGNVWKWAGQFRRSGKDIGIDAYKIPTELRQLLDNTSYRIDHDTYNPDEIAAHFHHQLVFIHPYANGNGRHARLVTDLLLASMDFPRFSWGRANLVDMGETRTAYIEALRAADRHDYGPLMMFVRS
jgi:Fic-DOC domain mobile mystery protein B